MCGEAKAAVAIVGLALPNQTLRGQVVVSLPSLAALRVLNLSGNAIRGAAPAPNDRILEVLDVGANVLIGGLARPPESRNGGDQPPGPPSAPHVQLLVSGGACPAALDE